MNNVIESEEYRDHTIKLVYDTYAPESPRDYYTGGTFLTWSRNRRSPDENPFDSPQDFLDHAEYEAYPIVLPVYKYEHSGIAYRTTPFTSRWDSGQVGYIYMDTETLEEDFSGDEEAAKKCLKAEVSEYSDWANGEVYGFNIEDKNGEHVDSCYGFIGQDGFKYAKEEAKLIVDIIVKRQEREEQKRQRFFRTVWAD